MGQLYSQNRKIKTVSGISYSVHAPVKMKVDLEEPTLSTATRLLCGAKSRKLDLWANETLSGSPLGGYKLMGV